MTDRAEIHRVYRQGVEEHYCAISSQSADAFKNYSKNVVRKREKTTFFLRLAPKELDLPTKVFDQFSQSNLHNLAHNQATQEIYNMLQ